MSGPQSYDEAPQKIRDAVEQLIKTYGSDPALLAGAIVSATCRAILAAKAEEREACARVAEFMDTDVPDEWLNVAPVRKRHAFNIATAIRKRGEG